MNYVLAKLFFAIIEEDIVPFKTLSYAERKELVADARYFRESMLWSRLIQSIKYKAQEQMFTKSRNWDDMYFGKAVLYIIELLDKRVSALSKLKNLSDE